MAMDEYSQKEREVWLGLRARAYWLLNHSEEITPKWVLFGMGFPCWRFWHFAVKEDPVRSWAIFSSPARQGKPERAAVREVTWLCTTDQQKVHNPAQSLCQGWDLTPTLVVRDVEVPVGKLEKILKGSKHLSVPLIPLDSHASSAKEIYGIEYTSPLIRLQWEGSGPAAWKDVIRWSADVRAFLHDCLKDVVPQ